jgi:hypothetical protein
MIYSKNYFEYDSAFLKEITELFISNLTDLNNGLIMGFKTNDPGLFLRSYYRSKTTLNLVGNENLQAKAELISEMLKEKTISELDMFLVNSFRTVCQQEIDSLSARLKYYENYGSLKVETC